MKKCRKCKQEKPLDNYYMHSQMADKHLNICKACTRKRVIVHREKNLEKIRAYDRERRSPENLNCRQREKRLAINKAWRGKDKRRAKAHNIVARKLQKTKPDSCAICDRDGLLHAHHPDYSRPEEVIWCCPACHKQLHKDQTLAICQ